MIDTENFPMEQDPIPGQEDENTNLENGQDLETQEQINSENLVQQIEQENADLSDTSGSITSDANMGIRGGAIVGGRAGESAAIAAAEYEKNLDDRPSTKNLAGDNPPGAEDQAFNSEHPGDITSEQVKYNAENIRENFRENIDKTASEINLDKKLKEGEE